MNKLKLIANIILFALLTLVSGQKLLASEESKLERIGGNFKIEKITKLSRGGFLVQFKAAEGNPKISTLRLESDHINAGLIEGSVIRLSADVIARKGSEAEVSQVVVFMPGTQGSTPVWMMSKSGNHFAPPAKLLEMHAPTTDYAVF